MNKPFISIIMVNWNGKEDTVRAVKSLLKSTYQNFEIIIADNDSADGSREVLSGFDKVKVINTGSNIGFAPASNFGYNHSSKGDFIFICANDSEIEPDCLSKLVKAADDYLDYDIFSPVEYEINEKDKIQQFGCKIDFFGFPHALTNIRTLESVKDEDILYLPGGSLFIRKKVIEKNGLYDNDYFLFVDDMDLGWRAQIAGFKLKLIKDAKFYHHGFTRLSEKEEPFKYSILKKRYMSERHYLNSILKNFQIYTLIFVLPFYFLTNIIEMAYFLAHRRVNFSLIYPRAWYWNFKYFGKLLYKRKKVSSVRKKSDLYFYPKIYKGWGKLYTMRKEVVPGMPRLI